MDLAYRPCDFPGHFWVPGFLDAIFAAHAMARATIPMSKLTFFAIESRVSSRLKPLVFASANRHSMAQRWL